jgi:hypothetical protein
VHDGERLRRVCRDLELVAVQRRAVELMPSAQRSLHRLSSERCAVVSDRGASRHHALEQHAVLLLQVEHLIPQHLLSRRDCR